MYNNMITTPGNMFGYLLQADGTYYLDNWTNIYPQIIHKTASISIIADNLPTRMTTTRELNTITKAIRLASLTISIHDPDGSYARTSEQSTILFKINKERQTTFNVAQQLLQENKNNPILRGL